MHILKITWNTYKLTPICIILHSHLKKKNLMSSILKWTHAISLQLNVKHLCHSSSFILVIPSQNLVKGRCIIFMYYLQIVLLIISYTIILLKFGSGQPLGGSSNLVNIDMINSSSLVENVTNPASGTFWYVSNAPIFWVDF